MPALLERAGQRRQAEGFEIEWVEADPHELPRLTSLCLTDQVWRTRFD